MVQRGSHPFFTHFMRGVPLLFFNPPGVSSFFLGHFHGILNISSESLDQAPSIATLFEQIG
jgi:hypothetical protein